MEFERNRTWHWFITIPVGSCEPDDVVLKRIRRITNELCRTYLVSRYHRLPDAARFVFDVAFEGERRCGDRHAHILVYVPMPTKKRISREMLVNQFPHEFRYWWARLRIAERKKPADEVTATKWLHEFMDPMFSSANIARSIYTVKAARREEVPWSRVEFANAPKTNRFTNRNLNVIHNRNKQRRAYLKAVGDPLFTSHAV